MKRQIVSGFPPVLSFKKTFLKVWFSVIISDKIRGA